MKALEAAPQQRPRRSGRAKHKFEVIECGGCAPPVLASPLPLTAQIEPFAKIAHELPPLFERHWQELALNKDTIELQPDWQRYYGMDFLGVLKVMTARSGDMLVGYIFNLITTHLHYRTTLCAEIEMFWLDPSYRGGTFALRWFKDNEAELKRLGVKLVSVGVKNHYLSGRVGSIFRRMGYKPVETIWGKAWP